MTRWPIIVAALAACGDNSDGWRPLFDGKTLDGWYSYIPSQGKGSDPLGFFRVEDGTIHILGVDLAPGLFEFAYLATEREYENFRVRFEYKWGPRNFVGWGPDSGFFFAAVGPDMIWPRSQECQVYLGDTGSTYMFDYSTFETTIDPTNPVPTYMEDGAPYVLPRNAEPNFARVTHSAAYDTADDWNAVEVISYGDSSEFIVNGNTTFRNTRRKQPSATAPDDPSQDVSLIKGRLVLQEEGNEIYFRNLEIQTIY